MTDYAFYHGEYGGTLPEEHFVRLRCRASAYLASITLGKSGIRTLPKQVLQSVNMALCAVVDAMYKAENGGDISSETNDGISVTYAARTGTAEQRLRNAAAPFLSGTGLLYRGCCF